MLGTRSIFGTRLDLWAGPEDFFYAEKKIGLSRSCIDNFAEFSHTQLAILVDEQSKFNRGPFGGSEKCTGS